MGRHWSYLKYVARHKWFVLLAGLELGVPLWQLIVHDWSKFLPSQWIAYATFFYLPNGKPTYKSGNAHTPGAIDAFDRAWNEHQKRERHHWQYWLLTKDDGKTTALEMPYLHTLEMVADWMGAGRAQGNSNAHTWRRECLRWYDKNCGKMTLHPATRSRVEGLLSLEAITQVGVAMERARRDSE